VFRNNRASVLLAILSFILTAGCAGGGGGAFQPSPPRPVNQNREGTSQALHPDPGPQAVLATTNDPSLSKLTAIVGQGTGTVIVAPTAKDGGTFSAEITINVNGAPPNTTFFVQRAPDLVANGICTGTYIKNVGVTLTTDSSGAGATHFFFERGAPFVSGVQFDVVFQVYTADLSTILQSECMTVTVK
jgi:hypothetical protein